MCLPLCGYISMFPGRINYRRKDLPPGVATDQDTGSETKTVLLWPAHLCSLLVSASTLLLALQLLLLLALLHPWPTLEPSFCGFPM